MPTDSRRASIFWLVPTHDPELDGVRGKTWIHRRARPIRACGTGVDSIGCAVV